MTRFYSYLNSAKEIIISYTGQEPFANYLKKYFAQFSKFGSRDRKQIAHLCYCYFRAGHALDKEDIARRIIQAYFLCSNNPDDFLRFIDPALNSQVQLPLAEKLTVVGAGRAFKWTDHLSAGIDPVSFDHSFFIQPATFIRVRPGKESIVPGKLERAGIAYSKPAHSAIAVESASKLDEVIETDVDAVIQDLSSQEAGEKLRTIPDPRPESMWDCCAASGGKSLMALDILGNLELTVTDIRNTILQNLKKRFAKAGVNDYRSFVADISGTKALPKIDTFGLIIADLPCTGSGTWGRTPEQLIFFEESKILHYVDLQRKILQNIIPHLAPNGWLLYITCSVFKEENEEAVKFIEEHSSLSLVSADIIKGYDRRSDTMFAALFQYATA